jgi:hypothetical protein
MHPMRRREGYIEIVQKLIETLTPAERTEGLAPEDRLAGLAPEEQILALSTEALRGLPEDYVRSLPAHVQQVIRERLGSARGRYHRVEHSPGHRSTTRPVSRSEYNDETMQRLMATLTPAERLAGLAPAERLTDLAPEEQILALSTEALRGLPEDYVRSLPASVQQRFRQRLGSSR